MNVLVICFGYDASLLQIRGPNYARDKEINPKLDKIRRKNILLNYFCTLLTEAPFRNVFVLYKNCPNSFRHPTPSVKRANV